MSFATRPMSKTIIRLPRFFGKSGTKDRLKESRRCVSTTKLTSQSSIPVLKQEPKPDRFRVSQSVDLKIPLPQTNNLKKLIDTQEHNEYLHSIISGTKVLFLVNHFNTLTQRVETELKDYDVWVTVREVKGKKDIIKAVAEVEHDIILCPYLTRKVPKIVWDSEDGKPCLILHPGIPGDRGPSSIDWALKMQAPRWGLTVLQADEEMDAGDIWASKTFRITSDTMTKTELYVADITDAAADASLLALVRFRLGISPVPLDYGHPDVKGTLMPMMQDKDRIIDWNSSAFDVGETVRMADTQPGGIGELHGDGRKLRFYGAKYTENLMFNGQSIRDMMFKAVPGQVLGYKDEAILIKCGDNNGLWISHLKDPKATKPLKVPATYIYPKEKCLDLSFLPSYREIWTELKDGVAYVHFDFYNGAMSVQQCKRLSNTLRKISQQRNVEVVCLMGGFRFFSTGIHLNVIEHSDDAAAESYANICSIDDVIKDVFSMSDKLTVACLQGNAGAGGAMMAAAHDFVIAHKSVVLTPSYQAMHLYGSEYWTYFLPHRVGTEMALTLTNGTKSIMASKAEKIGLVDIVLGRNRHELLGELHPELLRLKNSSAAKKKMAEKRRRSHEWLMLLEEHREEELKRMRECFKSDDYHQARKKFVYH